MTTYTMTELIADAKRVYSTGYTGLVELTDKYDVTTASLSYAKANPSSTFASLGVQAFGTKSKEKEIQRKLYATIKGLMTAITALQPIAYTPRTDIIEPVGKIMTSSYLIAEEVGGEAEWRIVGPLVGWGEMTHHIVIINRDFDGADHHYLARLSEAKPPASP